MQVNENRKQRVCITSNYFIKPFYYSIMDSSSFRRTSPSLSADDDLSSNISPPDYCSSSFSSSSSFLKSRASIFFNRCSRISSLLRRSSSSFIDFSSFSSSSSKSTHHRYPATLLVPVSAVMLVWSIVFASLTLTSVNDDLILNWDEYGTTASQKLDILWERISSNREPEPYPGLVELLIRGFLFQTDHTERLTKSYTFRPFDGTRKMIHSQSAYSRIKWSAVPNALNYTGLFADEDVFGYMTYSKGSRIAANTSSSWGVGLKLFRDYDLPAGHVLCNNQFVLGQISTFQWNIFASMPCGHVDFITGLGLMLLSRRRTFNLTEIENTSSSSLLRKVLQMKFWTLFPSIAGVSNMAVKTKTGKVVENPNFPFALCLRPNPQLTHEFSEQHPWFHPIEQMRNVPSGTYLYDVIVLDSPNKVLTGLDIEKHFIKIAEIHSDSEFVSSRWGDQRLSVQHQKFEDDLELRPSWKKELTLKTLMLDGVAYLPANKAVGIPPTKEQIFYSFFPGFQGIMNALFTSVGLKNFLAYDIGLGDIPAMISNIKLHSNPVSSPIRNLSASKNNYTKFDVENEKKEERVGAPKEMMMTTTDTAEVQRENEKEKEKVFEDLVDYVIRTFLHNKTPEESSSSLDESFSIFSNYSSSAPPFTPSSSLTPQQQRILSSFMKNVSPRILFDGHFIRPMNFLGLKSLFTEPIIMAIAQAILRQYTHTYGISFYREIIRALITSSINPVTLLSDVQEILNFFRIQQIVQQREETVAELMKVKKIKEALFRIETSLHEPMIKLGELNLFSFSNAAFAFIK